MNHMKPHVILSSFGKIEDAGAVLLNPYPYGSNYDTDTHTCTCTCTCMLFPMSVTGITPHAYSHSTLYGHS